MYAMPTSSVDSKPKKTCAAVASWRPIITLCKGGGQRVWRDGMGEGEERGEGRRVELTSRRSTFEQSGGVGIVPASSTGSGARRVCL